MREIIFKWVEMRELSENARDSREMHETWQVWHGLPSQITQQLISQCEHTDIRALFNLSGQSTEGRQPRAGRLTKWAYHLHTQTPIQTVLMLSTRLNAFVHSCLFNATAVAAQCHSQQTNSEWFARRRHQYHAIASKLILSHSPGVTTKCAMCSF